MDAEVARDEFGGYCCKRWGKKYRSSDSDNDDDDNQEDICRILGLNID